MLIPLLAAATLTVAATSTDLRSLVVAVGGDRVRVESLTDPHQDPHAAELHPRQLLLLARADLLVRIGLDHEPWLARALGSVKMPAHDLDCSKTVALLGTETPRLREASRPHVHAFGNTHYWLDPENAGPLTGAILAELSRLLPDGRATFAQNRAGFLARVETRLREWEELLRPYAGTRVVVVHDTWPYFARRFGLEIAGTVEEQPGVPPSPAYLGQLMQRMKAARIKVLIAEPASPAALVARIAEGTGARIVTLAPSVGSDPEATDYLALFDVDVRRLARALGAGPP